ncbi:COX3 domain-containing protein [Balamuthia mandrillaris]
MFGRNVQRTSDSHALVVDFIPVEDAEHGRLGMSFAPGKHQQRALYGPWKRDLDKDLNVLLGTYDVDVLVTLLPQEECEELAIPKLLRKVKARRIESIHYPIQLGTIPKEKDYPQLLALVRRIVDLWREQHKTVIVHCRGGLARTGMVVCGCCIVGLGDTAEEAIKRIRKVRGDAIPQKDQQDFVHHFHSFFKKQRH